MIARRLRMNSTSKSSFRRLAHYLTNPQGSSQRVLACAMTNCETEDLDWAVMEIMATQALNTRARGNKTYHLVVSFTDKPEPDATTIKEIERRLCDDLGFTDHQRISVLHGDTDNLHLHIAINKIHPTKLTMHDPYYDHTTLAKSCVELEHMFNVAADNHEFRTTARPTAAQSMEAAGDLESLIGWIQRSCRDQLLSATSWEDLHGVLAEHDLKLKPRGNGFIISSGKLSAKASSIDRRLSKSQLEKRLGPFAAQTHTDKKSTKSYQVRPMPRKTNHEIRERLWREYQAFYRTRTAARKQELHQLQETYDDAIRGINSQFRHSITQYFIKGIWKRMLYAMEHAERRRKIKEIRKKYTDKRTQIYKNNPRITWREWLNEEAKQGNKDALRVIRSRGKVIPSTNRIIPDDSTVLANPTRITHRGSRLYADGVRENSGAFQLSTKYDENTILAILKRTETTKISLSGSTHFIKDVLSIAKKYNLNLKFAQPTISLQWRNMAKANKTSKSRSR